MTHTFSTRDFPISAPRRCLVLVLIWSKEEPERVGEVLRVPPQPGGWLFGRWDDVKKQGPHLVPVQIRPEGVGVCPDFKAPRVSRRQLELCYGVDGKLLVTSVGKCPLKVNGEFVKTARVQVGDVLELWEQLAFYVSERGFELPRWPDELPKFDVNYGRSDVFGCIGESEAAWQIRYDAAFAALRDTEPVLVSGPRGCGKDLLCLMIHALSRRQNEQFTPLVCSDGSDVVLPVELFGCHKDASGGKGERAGLFERAGSGTLHLDQIEQMNPEVQSTLKDVLQKREFRRLGEVFLRSYEARVILSSSYPDLLNEDLLHTPALTITIPPLENRREDIPLLVWNLLTAMAKDEDWLRRRYFPDGDVDRYPLVGVSLISGLMQCPLEQQVWTLRGLLSASFNQGLRDGSPRLEWPRNLPLLRHPWDQFTRDVRELIEFHHLHQHDNQVLENLPEKESRARTTLSGERKRFLVESLQIKELDLGQALTLLGLEPWGSPRWKRVPGLRNLADAMRRLILQAGDEVAQGKKMAGGSSIPNKAAAQQLLDWVAAGRLRWFDGG